MSSSHVSELRAGPAQGLTASAKRRSMSRRVIFAVGVAIVLVVAGGLTGWLYLTARPPAPSPKGDGPTFDEALAAVELGLSAVGGGPWTVFSAVGVATPRPFQPASLGWADSANATNACRAALPGLTVWNGTMPLFNGSDVSGTAPFWQLMFFSNASSEIVVGTDVSGHVTVFPPFGMRSPCGIVLEGKGPLWGWADYDLDLIHVDSSVLAQTAWSAIGSTWVPSHPPSVEVYTFGETNWPLWPSGIMVSFERCGLRGAAGPQPYVFADINGNGSLNNAAYGLETCTPETNVTGPNLSGTPVPYVNEFSNGTVVSVGATTYAAEDLRLAEGFGPDPSLAGYGEVGWMVRLTLSDANGQALRSAPTGCASWVRSIGDCAANATGWYAVLGTQQGTWLDSFPSSVNESDWADPVGAILGNETLTIVVPSSWNVTGDVLRTTATGTTVPVMGSAVLV